MKAQFLGGRRMFFATVLLLAISSLGCKPATPEEELKIDPDDPGAADVCNLIYLPPLQVHSSAPHPTQSAALAINDAGQIVGYSKGKVQNSGGVWTTSQLAVVWAFFAPADVAEATDEGFECHGSLAETDLVPCVRRLTFSTSSAALQGAAMDIANPAADDELGTVVGWAGPSSANRRPYRWPKAANGDDVSGTASLKYPVARGINSRGVISGTTWEKAAQNTIRGFVVGSSTSNVAPQLRRIAVDGAVDIAAGSLEGTPVLYRPDPQPLGASGQQLTALGGYGSAEDLVATRVGILLVGSTRHRSGPAVPASWLVQRSTPGGSTITLPTRPPPRLMESEGGASAGAARGVSLVGREVHAVGVAGRPMLWKDGELGRDLANFVLPSCSGTLLEANDINASGHVVGVGQLGPGVERRGFFLRPEVVTMYNPDKLEIRKEIVGGTEESGEIHVIEDSVVTFRFQLTHQYSQTVPATVHEKLPTGVAYVQYDGGTCDQTPWEESSGGYTTDVKIPPEGCYVDMQVHVKGSPGDEINNAEYKLVAGNEKPGELVKAIIDQNPAPPLTLTKNQYGTRCPGGAMYYQFDVENASGDYTIVEQLPTELENATNSEWPTDCRAWVDQGGGTYEVSASPGDRICSLRANIKSSVVPGTQVDNDTYELRLTAPPNNTYAGVPEEFTVSPPPPPPSVEPQFVIPDTNIVLESAAPGDTVSLVFVTSGELVVSTGCQSRQMDVTLPSELEFVGTGSYQEFECPMPWTCDQSSGETRCTGGVSGPFLGLYGACPMEVTVSATQPVNTSVSVTQHYLDVTCPCGSGMYPGPAATLLIMEPPTP